MQLWQLGIFSLAALTITLRSKKALRGDEVLIPAVCWSTSLWPIVQMGLVPVFVDVDVATMNVDLDDLGGITDKTRGVLAVHVLGNMCDMDRLMIFVPVVTCSSSKTRANRWEARTAGNAWGRLGVLARTVFTFPTTSPRAKVEWSCVRLKKTPISSDACARTAGRASFLTKTSYTNKTRT